MKQIFLTLSMAFALMAIVINFVFVILVMARTSRRALYIIFASICISVMLWNLGEFMAQATGRRFWPHVSLVGAAMIPSLMFHFIVTILRRGQKSRGWVVTAYVFSGLLASMALPAVFLPGFRPMVEGGLWDASYLVMFLPFFISGIILLFNAIGRSDSDEERSRLRYILAAAIIGVVTASADHAQALGFPAPRLGPFGSVLYPSILAIGLFRHFPAFDVLAQTRLRLEILNEMAAGLAHEVRNPLSSLKGAARLLSGRLKAPDEPGCRQYLDVITEEVERLDGILENFQHFTRPLKVEKAPVSISEVVRKTVRLAEADTHDMKIGLELSEEMGMVRADALLMKQVFLNIIKNAAEACGRGGKLTIRVGHASTWAKVSFADNGTGIPRETMGRLFEPFFTTKTAGMGMGLSVSQRIVQAHDGRIEVRNISPQGAEFSILLPL